MPKYDLTQKILEPNGKPAEKDGKEVTVKDALEVALLSEYTADQKALAPEKKNQRFKLWRKLTKANGSADLTIEEAATLKECIAAFPTITYGQLAEVLDGVAE